MIPVMVSRLQAALDEAGVGLKLFPGGEINLRDSTRRTPPDEVVTYGLARRFVLMDFWDDPIPGFFEPSVEFFQSLGVKVVLAHQSGCGPCRPIRLWPTVLPISACCCKGTCSVSPIRRGR